MNRVTRTSALLVALALLLTLAAGPALAGDSTRAAPSDPSFHREFGVFYDRVAGDVYVSDSLNNQIIRTKMDGSGWATLGTLGDGQGQFRDPRGIYFDSASGFIYVTDTGNHRVVKTRMDGSGWQALGSQGNGAKQFYYPRGIWYDSASREIYVPDTGNNRIVRTAIDGSDWATMGSEGRGPGQFLTPRGVQYDPVSGLLYVADTGNSRVVQCSWDGSTWNALGSFGTGDGHFREPRSLYWDAASSFLYVADQSNNRVLKTRIDGSGWQAYGSFGNGQGQFYFPRGISFDGSGTVYVADTFNDRIVATKMDGTGWTSIGVRWEPYVWFFAEGSTRQDFQMFLTICNPGDKDADVHINYILGDGSQVPQVVKVIAHSRYTINVNKVVGPDKDVSIKAWSTEPVIMERPMYFHYKKWPGGHDVVGRPQLDTEFYFAEGTTRDGFQTYLCLQNPNDGPANVVVDYMFANAPLLEQKYTVNPHSRTTIDVNKAVGPGKDVSMVVKSDVPILAERPMYFDYNGRITGGHVVIGASEPDTHFYLAEGTTNAGFNEYVCLLNPGDTDATVNLKFMCTDGTVIPTDVVVKAKSRYTVDVNAVVGPGKDVGLEITSDEPIVVERPMYFVYKGLIVGGHNVMATTDLGTDFTFAEGTTRPGFEEWICLMNPGDVPTDVTVTYMFSDGSTQLQNLTVGPHSRATIMVNQVIPADKDVSLSVHSTQPIVVERPIYFNYQGNTTGGSDAMGYSN